MAAFAYMFYPGSCFLIANYPTSLMNLLAIISILCMVKNKNWAAAVIAGIGTAAGPLMAVLGLSAIFKMIKETAADKKMPTGRKILKIIISAPAMGLLSLSGFLIFAAYQWHTFNDPLASSQVQAAWGQTDFNIRIINLVTLKSVFYPAFLKYLYLTSSKICGLETAFNGIIFFFALFLVWAQRKLLPFYLTLFSLLSVLGYDWLLATIQGPATAIRHLYLVVPAFLGLGPILEKRPLLADALMVILPPLLLLQSALFITGNYVL